MCTTSYVERLQQRLERVHAFAREQLKLSSDKMKRYYDLNTTQTRLEEGDPVWLYNPQRKKGLSPKLQKPWQGPYVILKRINDLVYRIQLGPRSKPKVVHFNRLWRYQGENPPQWFAKTSTGSSPSSPSGDHAGKTANDDEGADPEVEDADPEVESAVESVPESSSAPRRSGRQRRRPERYAPEAVGHPRRLVLKEGGGVTKEMHCRVQKLLEVSPSSIMSDWYMSPIVSLSVIPNDVSATIILSSV